MRRWLHLLLAGLVVCSPVRVGAQELFQQDYFAASQDQAVMSLLQVVEKYHLNQTVLDAFQRGEYVTVLGDMQYVLNRFSNHPRALMIVTSLSHLMDQSELPIAYFDRALQLYPQYALTHAQYGYYLVSIGDHATGIAKLNDAIRMQPNLAPAHAWLAEAYYQIDDVANGREAAERARALGYRGEIPSR